MLNFGVLAVLPEEVPLDTLDSDIDRDLERVAGSGWSISSKKASSIDMAITACSADTTAAWAASSCRRDSGGKRARSTWKQALADVRNA